MPSVAVAILNYNGETFLKKFLPIMIRHSHPFEVYVIDNGSTDNSTNYLRSNHPEVKLIELTSNLGFAGGYNAGLADIDSDYYALVNSDIEVTEKWLSPLVEFLEKNENYAACQPKILSFHQRNKFEYAGACGGFLDHMGYPYCRGRIFDEVEEDHAQYEETLDVFWTSGACLLIRKKDFFEVGAFDKDFFAHMEEIDLCWRLFAHERKLACIPQSTVYHVGGGTLSKLNPRKTYLNFRNGLSLLAKNLPLTEFWRIPIRMMLDVIAGIKFWIDNDFKHMKAVLQAHWDFIVSFNHDLNKRSSIKNQRSISQFKNLKSTNVVWDHYILRKKKFKDLG
jgi:hypothetical protein